MESTSSSYAKVLGIQAVHTHIASPRAPAMPPSDLRITTSSPTKRPSCTTSVPNPLFFLENEWVIVMGLMGDASGSGASSES